MNHLKQVEHPGLVVKVDASQRKKWVQSPGSTQNQIQIDHYVL